MTPRPSGTVLVLVALVSLLVALGGAVMFVGCCAIDPERFPEIHAANRRRQATAGMVALGALGVGVASAAGAVLRRPRRRDRPERGGSGPS